VNADVASALVVREIGAAEFERAWPVFHAVVAAGDTYSYPPDITLDEARALWTTPPSRCFVAESDARVLGCYMLRPNQPGLGNHVANCGYMVAPAARGQGIAGHMCAHSLAEARRAGFRAMQFNFVVASNAGAVRLWQRHGFAIVGTVPQAFRHAHLGATDIHVMHRFL
jgi:ribosomal protein S18 acetylase RimI-like enzyme